MHRNSKKKQDLNLIVIEKDMRILYCKLNIWEEYREEWGKKIDMLDEKLKGISQTAAFGQTRQ